MTPKEPDEAARLHERLEKHDSFKATDKYTDRSGACIWLALPWLGALVWHDFLLPRSVSILLIVLIIGYLIWNWRVTSKIHDEMTKRQMEEYRRFMEEYHQKRHDRGNASKFSASQKRKSG